MEVAGLILRCIEIYFLLLLKAKELDIIQGKSQSPGLNSIEHAFHLLTTKLKAEISTNRQTLKAAAIKALTKNLKGGNAEFGLGVP